MIKKIVKKIINISGFELTSYDRSFQAYDKLYEKYKNYTMISDGNFLLNLDLCNAYKHIEGCYVECGVWKGGMSAAISEVIGAKKRVHLFDSFEGLPAAKEIDGADALAWQNDVNASNYYDNCSAEESFAREAMKLARNENYKVYKGWFDQTLGLFPKESIAILRLDGDWYDSNMVCLKYLFPYVQKGGIIILDDYYGWEGCSKAVHDYLSETKSVSHLHEWKRSIPFILKK